MIVDFNEIPKWGKLWVFPSSRKFYPQEIEEVKTATETFLSEWTNDNEPLKCSYQLKYNRFILITVDDTNVTLSLKAHDSLTAFILGLEAKYDIVLLDKINVCFKQGEFVQYKDLKEFKTMIKNKGVSKKTVVFNNMITSKEELTDEWEINIMESWLNRFFK